MQPVLSTILLSSLGKLLIVGSLCSGSMPQMILLPLTPLETTDSDRIVGIKCDFPNYSPLFILSVYLPSMNDKIEDFNEYFDHLWALYDTLSTDGYSGDIRNSLGEKGKKETIVRPSPKSKVVLL